MINGYGSLSLRKKDLENQKIPATAFIELDHTSETSTAYYFSGDVELDSKPTWSY